MLSRSSIYGAMFAVMMVLEVLGVAFPARAGYLTFSGTSGDLAVVQGETATVDGALTLSEDGGDATTITNGRVMIDNPQTGDVLGVTDADGILTSSSYDSDTGILTLTGSGTATQWQTLFRAVTFTTTSTSSENRSISFTLGDSLTLEVDGEDHYYEVISSEEIRWDDARDAAALKSYFGLQGYLATVTSAAENALLTDKLAADAWLGGSDDYSEINDATGGEYTQQTDTEGNFYWVTGPETGDPISTGNYSSSDGTPTLAGSYMNWNDNEPNDSTDEHCLEIYYSGGESGKWNDLAVGSTNVDAYVVEYGGTDDDPELTLSITRTVTVNTLPTDITLSTTEIDVTKGVNGLVATISTTDADSSSFTYSLVEGDGDTDNDSFSISESSLLADDADMAVGSYDIRLKTDDGAGGTYEESFTLTVSDSDGDGVPDTQETADGSDPDDDTSYADSDGDGVPDYYEEKEDGTATDDGSEYTDSDGDGISDYRETHGTFGIASTDAVDVEENTTAVTTVIAVRAAAAVTYSISGGDDGAFFDINSLTGKLTFASPPDYESPADDDTNNDYVVEVQATDGTDTNTQTLTVTVTNVSDEPETWDARSLTNSQGELFLGGHYIELGISNWGDFGTVEGKPDTFFGTAARDTVGMSHDPDMFDNGLDLRMDYFLPGTPEERFAVGYESGSSTYTNSNAAQRYAKNMTTTVEDTSSGEKLSATIKSTWDDKMVIQQKVSFDEGDAFFRNVVTICNISDTTMDTVRYMRSFDPDNTKDQGGSYATENTVLKAIADGDGKEVVVAKTYSSSDPVYKKNGSRMPIFFYSKDERARVSIFGFSNSNPYASSAWDSPRAKNSTLKSDTAITITFEAEDLGPGEAARFVYYTSLDERDFDEVIEEIEADEEEDPVSEDVEEPIVSSSLLSIDGTPTDITNADTAYSFIPTVTNPDGDAVTFSIENQPSWAIFDASTGALSGTPSDSDAGTYTEVTISVSDSAGNSDTLTPFNIVVNAVNDAPELSGTPTTSISEGEDYSFAPTLSDADIIDVHKFSVENLPSWAEFDMTTGEVSGTPGADDSGEYSGIAISVEDGAGATASLDAFTITVSDANTSPRITSGDGFAVVEGETEVGSATAIDENGDTLSFSIGGTDADDFSIDAEGVITFNTEPDCDAPGDNNSDNVYEITLTVEDSGTPTGSDTQSVTVTVLKDSDGNGLSDIAEGDLTVDSDDDGTPDYLDEDDDGDGISDVDEGSGDYTDTDGDGTPDYKDEDSDNDGIADSIEGDDDTDGDGTPDYRDDDSDGDGIADSVEGSGDTDGDGTPDYLDDDSDGDGIADSVEGSEDSDDDGTPDYQDEDSDGDGVADSIEGSADTDNDGIPDYQDPDNDGDGISDSDEGSADNTDSDGDGIPDYRDSDSDGDGIEDTYEGTADTDGDGTPDYQDDDSDGDGISDEEEGSTDTDNDGTPDFQDPEADGDGVGDEVENGAANNGDGNGDGIADRLQKNVTTTTNVDGTEYVTLEAPEGTQLNNVQAIENPSPEDMPEGSELPNGLYEFTIANLEPGASVQLKIYLPEGSSADSYLKYGPTPDNEAYHWYEFVYDGITGAEIEDNVITLYFVDGDEGDDDLTADGTIVDAGGPMLDSGDSDDYGPLGGSGCFIGTMTGEKSPWALAGLAMGVLSALLALAVSVRFRALRRVVGFVVLACILTLSAPGAGQAEEEKTATPSHPFYVTAGLGFAYVDEAISAEYDNNRYDFTVDTDIYPVFRLGYMFDEKWALEFGFRWDIYSGEIDEVELCGTSNPKGYTYLLGPVYTFGEYEIKYLGAISPQVHLNLGLTFLHHDLNFPATEFEPALGLDVAVGARRGNIDLRLGYRYFKLDCSDKIDEATHVDDSLNLSGFYMEVAWRFDLGK